MTLIRHPGSDHQMAAVSIDAGHARDIMLTLAGARSVPGDLAGGSAPAAAAAQAAACLRDTGSLYTPEGLADALGEVITWLHQARRDAMAGIPAIS
jgi:hypothetical protein